MTRSVAPCRVTLRVDATVPTLFAPHVTKYVIVQRQSPFTGFDKHADVGELQYVVSEAHMLYTFFLATVAIGQAREAIRHDTMHHVTSHFLSRATACGSCSQKGTLMPS